MVELVPKASALLVICLAVSCTAAPHTITYKVRGPANWPTIEGIGPSAHIVVSNQQGGTEMSDEQLPYSRQITVGNGAFVYLSAQAKLGDEVACEIDVDGVPVRQSHSDGQFSIATCSGTV